MYALYRIITMILVQFSFSVLPGHAKSVCYGNVLRTLPGERRGTGSDWRLVSRLSEQLDGCLVLCSRCWYSP